MAGHHAEHARQTATLRWVALGILIPNTFFVEAALGRFARCRYSAIQNNVPPGSTLLDPRNAAQVEDYKRKLKEIYECTYELQRVEGGDRVIKIPRPK